MLGYGATGTPIETWGREGDGPGEIGGRFGVGSVAEAMAADLLKCLPELRLRRTTRPAAKVLATRSDGDREDGQVSPPGPP